MNKLFDPELKEAALEIQAILKKYNIAGQVILVSKTHAEFVNYIAPPDGPDWSALIREENGVRVKINAKTGGPFERVKAEATVHMAHQIRDISFRAVVTFSAICDVMHENMDIVEFPSKMTPHEVC